MKFFKILPIALLSAVACSFSVHAAEVSGQKVEDTAVVAGKTLKLNGAGIRSIGEAHIYLVAMYLTEKKNTEAGVLSVAGPKRLSLTFQRDLKAEALGQLFITASTKNSTKAEQAKVVNQIVQLGDIFAAMADLKKGDILTLDWTPGKGSIMALNGKAQGDPLPEVEFFNSLLRIWVHEPSTYPELTAQVLGR